MMSDLETSRIESGIRRIALNHTRKMSNDEIAQWSRELRKYAGQLLAKVLEDFALGTDFPNLGQIRAKYFAERQAAEGSKPARPLTAEERGKSDTTAIKSMLWLIYEKRWQPQEFAGHALARVFLGLAPDAEPTATQRAAIVNALTKAMEIYDRAAIARWMANQNGGGNE